jgi:hypothetical protein
MTTVRKPSLVVLRRSEGRTPVTLLRILYGASGSKDATQDTETSHLMRNTMEFHIILWKSLKMTHLFNGVELSRCDTSSTNDDLMVVRRRPDHKPLITEAMNVPESH